MPKAPISGRIDQDRFARLKAWWIADERDMSYAVDKCIEIALPILEADLKTKQDAILLRDQPSRAKAQDQSTPPLKYAVKGRSKLRGKRGIPPASEN